MCLVEGRDNYSSNNHLSDAAVIVWRVLEVTFRIVNGASSGLECSTVARAA